MNQLEVLVVDDEWNMRNLIRIYLSKNGFKVTEAPDGETAIQLVSRTKYDAIILDVMMPGLDGWEVCKRIRESSQVPIIMLTARTETKDKVHGLNLGADDYLSKPFESEELIARLHAILRRAVKTASAEERYTLLDIEVIPDGREVRVQGGHVDLTQKEFDLLHLFAKAPKRAFTREMLLEQCWGFDYEGDNRTVDTHVKNLRDKLQKAGLPYNPIQTVWGVGYKLNERGCME